MKKTILLLVFIASALLTFAQVPQSFKYQAVIRDAGNNLLSNQSVDVKISLISGSTTEYVETHAVTTTQYGLVNLNIGDGTLVSGDFSAIDWTNGNQSVKVEVDAGSGYEDLGSNVFQSVPYALASGDNSWTELSNGNIHSNNIGDVGIGTSYPTNKLSVTTYSSIPSTAGNVYTGHAAISVKNRYGSTGLMAGIVFGVSGATDPIGAGIFHERTGSNSQGSLHFATKSTATVDTLIPIRMTIDEEGMVGIGTTTPDCNLTILQPTAMTTSPNGLRFVYSTSNWKVYHSGSYLSFANNDVRVAYIAAGGAWTVTSDKRLKENITDMESILDRINQLEVKRYNYIAGTQEPTFGFLAQDVLPLFPEVVTDIEEENPYYGIAYGQMSIIAIKAIQEQQVIIEEQEIKIEEQETKIEKQDAKIDDLQTQIDELRNMIK